jgi:transcriptional regulator with XRE-family HTH domain
MDSQWLNAQFRLNRDKNKADLARALGLEPPAVSKILAGTRQIKAQEYMIMREFFGLPVDGNRSLRPAPMSHIDKKDTYFATDNPQDEGSWILPASIFKSRTNAAPENLKIFTVSEMTMEPEFRLGDPIIVDTADKIPSPPGIFMLSDGFGLVIRHCAMEPKSKPPVIKISASQKNFETQTTTLDDVEITGRVIAKLLWV